MLNYKICVRYLIIALLATLAACSGGGSSSSASFTVSNGQATSGAIGLSGGADDYSGTMTMSVSLRNSAGVSSNILPTVTMNPSNCVLVFGNPAQSTCEFIINSTSFVPNGNYQHVAKG